MQPHGLDSVSFEPVGDRERAGPSTHSTEREADKPWRHMFSTCSFAQLIKRRNTSSQLLHAMCVSVKEVIPRSLGYLYIGILALLPRGAAVDYT